MSFTLNGKTALITGAGRGIGRSIALALSASGAQVMVNDLDVGVLEETATMVRSQGGRAEAVAGDLTQPGTPDALVRTTLDRLGSLDIIVNNAGYTWDNVIQKTTDEQFQAMLDIHVVAPFRILRAASGWIRERAKQETAAGVRVMRKVVNITSISGTDGNAGQAGYSSGKSAIVGLTKTMAKEWGRYNVNVNAVGFGIIETRLTQVMQPGGTAWRSALPGVPMAGKTGTAQMRRRGRMVDNAWFVGFAPVPDPRIAVCVFVEGGGHGGEVAAPIARRMIATYLGLRLSDSGSSATRGGD